MEELYSREAFGCRTSWKTVCALVEGEEAFKVMLKADGYVKQRYLRPFHPNRRTHRPCRSTPGEIYGDYIDMLKEDYFTSSEELREIQKSTGFIFTPETTQEEYLTAFGKEDSFSKFRMEHKEMFFEEMQDYAERKKKDQERKLLAARRDYTDYLDYKFYKKIAVISWEEAKGILEERSVYRDLNDEKLAEELFLEYKASAAENAIVVGTEPRFGCFLPSPV